MSGSIYQVGVHLTAKDGVSGVLANISKSLLGLHGGVEHLQKGFNSLQVGLLGAAAVAAGVKLGHVTAKLVEHGFQLKHWQAQMSAAGASSKTVAEMTAKAWKLAGENMNTTATDNMKNIIELNKVTGDWAESAKMLPTFAKVETVLAAVKANGMHSGITGNSTQTLNFARGLEELGITTRRGGETDDDVQKRIEQYTQGFIKSMQVSRGLFDGNQLYSSTNNSAGAAQNWDFRMATQIAPVIGEIMKAGKFGNADYMTLKSFQGGHITGDAAEALFNYHLVGADDLKRNDKGKVIGLRANTEFARGMETNLWDWANRTLETLRKSGMNIEDQNAVNKMINEIGSNKSNSGILRALLEPHEHAQIEKELRQLDKVPDNVASMLDQNDPFIKLQNLQKKWDDFLTALGGPLVDPAMKALDGMTKAINSMSQYLVAHPEAAELVAKGLAAVSGGLVGIGTALTGTVLVAALGPTGWLVAGIAALATAVAAFNPDAFSNFVNSIKSMMSTLDDLLGLPNPFKKDLQSEKPIQLPGGGGLGLRKKTSYDGLNDIYGGGIIHAAFGGTNDNISAIAAGTRAGFLDAMQQLGFGGGSGSSAGIGGGIINASYGGGANDNFRVGSGRYLGSGGGGGGGGGAVGGYGGLADDVMNRADGAGFNTRGVRNMNPGNIGWGGWARAHGAVSGAGADSGHLVAVFPSFEAGYAAMGALALSKYGAGARSIDQLIAGAHGWTPGNHAAAANVARMMGISPFADAHLNDPAMMAKFKAGLSVQELGPAGAKYARGHVAGPPPKKPAETVIHNHTHLDGRIVAQSVTRHQAYAGTFPTGVGGMDAHSSFASPGTPFIDAA